MDARDLFLVIRDIPYRIPLAWGEEDDCCSGKHEKLLHLLRANAYPARYRVCTFLWSSLPLPPALTAIPHEDDCTHTYLEILIDGHWSALDATWDEGLKKVFPVNDWDGASPTPLAVTPLEIFTPEKSLELVKNQDEAISTKDLAINGTFYMAFNDWLAGIRTKNTP